MSCAILGFAGSYCRWPAVLPRLNVGHALQNACILQSCFLDLLQWYDVGGPLNPACVCVQLPNLGINQQFISFTNVTMESDKFICVRETGASNSVVIVDLAAPLTPLKRPITADSALMNPATKVIALKASVAGAAGDSLQIFNLEMKSKMKSFQIAQPVVFWKWITPSKLGLVTASTVYHWDMNVSNPLFLTPMLTAVFKVMHDNMSGVMPRLCSPLRARRCTLSHYLQPVMGTLLHAQGPSDPEKVFDRTANLENTQIINYRVDAAEKWCVLIGIAPGAAERYVPAADDMQHVAHPVRSEWAGKRRQNITFALASKTGWASGLGVS